VTRPGLGLARDEADFSMQRRIKDVLAARAWRPRIPARMRFCSARAPRRILFVTSGACCFVCARESD
jgi:hypothetical protein